jgi:DNA-binding CsgD family transcriptional regulator/catechol 2,3-dioxygenase-like lactoylglutathione lyase family enzyme
VFAQACEGARTPGLVTTESVVPLTPRERDGAVLAVQGVQSKDEYLYLVRRTVNNHLQSAYTKLGVSSRAELTGVLGDVARSAPFPRRPQADPGGIADMGDEEGPVLDQINLVVRDMEAMVGFYRRLGVRIGDSDAPWNRHHRTAELGGGLDLDLDSTEFASMWDQGWPAGRTGAVIGFKLRDRAEVDRRFADLVDAGYTPHQAPYDAFWGARYAIVEDPDGNAVGLMSPRDPDRRSPPPALPD